MKMCCTCKQNQPESGFSVSNGSKDGLQARCKSCVKLYYQKYGVKHRRNVRKNTKNRKSLVHVLMLERFADGCKDCGNLDIRVLQFDHLPEFKKSCNPSDLLRNAFSVSKAKIELDKCEVVCANCHHIRTYARSPSWRSRLLELAGTAADF